MQEIHNMEEVMKGVDAKKWEQAMQKEYNSLMAKGTWKLSLLLCDRTSIGCKWVFCTKRVASSNIVPYKSRLVAKGYSQVEGIDSNEMFVLVAKLSTI